MRVIRLIQQPVQQSLPQERLAAIQRARPPEQTADVILGWADIGRLLGNVQQFVDPDPGGADRGLHGEYDVDVEPAVEKEGDDRFWVDGGLPLDDLSELLGIIVEREDVATVGGLVYSELGRVPKPGEELRIEGFRVVVEQIARRRIMRVYFERLVQQSNGDTDAGSVE